MWNILNGGLDLVVVFLPSQLQALIQEILLAVKTANPDRVTGYEKSGQMPNRQFVRRLVERNNISLRRTAEISKGI